MLGRYSFVAMPRFVHPDKDFNMNTKTLLLYAALACGGVGAGAVIYPYVTDPGNVAKVQQQVEESGNVQRQGPPPRRTPAQGF
jgi:hypothetical protein